MKKSLVILALLLAAGSASADNNSGPIGYPGSTWSVLTVNPSPIGGTPEDNNVLLQGSIEQGVDWFRFGPDKKWKLNTYFQLGYSGDKNGLAYNNKLSPAVGIKMTREFNNGVLDLGLAVVKQHSFRGVTEGASKGTGVNLYASYWFGWNLKK